MPEFQSLTLLLITIIVATAYILGRFVDYHENSNLKSHNYDSVNRSKINSYPQTEMMRKETLDLVAQELRDRKLIGQTVKKMMSLQNKSNFEEMEVYDIKTGQKIKYYKENS